ncbi:sodium:proton antiporter [Synechococcus sp. RSCCF101]|uniref:cation:proton antiporter domain-containing protein n=1 Tax=Synechococcus sp. RSCCF101 TaxID=2511069 RepID=UPI0012461EBF|nr:cation:proton antiporter [Synechococcus sp. RSCCF101]QEY33133.1 sodium:proton antiporter [Synechococcus sp. RSCCF101]
MDALIAWFHEEPLGSFALLLAISLAVPPLFERMRLPGVLGLLAAGVLLGPQGLRLLSGELPVVQLLADVGLLYLMFVAGLEIDLNQLRKVRNRALGFGTLTFLVPLLAGSLLARAFGFGWTPSILIGSLLSSHSLMTYPLLRRLGVVANEAVTVTIGATILTDIAALILLAVCLGIHAGGFSAGRLVSLLLLLSLYTVVVLVGIDRGGRIFFRRSGSDEGKQFLFVLLAVFLAALTAELVGVEKIVGAFLAGLAVNDVVGDGPVKEKVVFVGSVLFIPIFFVDIGLLVDGPALLNSVDSLGLAAAIVLTLLISKLAAAALCAGPWGYSTRETLTMWAMSIPQVATTLAAVLVAHRVGLVSDAVLNSVVVLMVVTATLGPLLISRVAVGLNVPEASLEIPERRQLAAADGPMTVMVPLHNPGTEPRLIALAALIAQRHQGRIVPLTVALARPLRDRAGQEADNRRNQQLLRDAEAHSRRFAVSTEPLFRLDDSIPLGIVRASQEQQADLVVMGWSDSGTLPARVLGSVIGSVFSQAPCPVVVARMRQAPQDVRRILVPVETFTSRGIRMAAYARLLTEALDARVSLLHVMSPARSGRRRSWAGDQLEQLAARVGLPETSEMRVRDAVDVAGAIVREAEGFDLVILHSQRQPLAAEGFGFSILTNALIRRLASSSIVIGEAPES